MLARPDPASSVHQLKLAALPLPLHMHGVAGEAGLGACEAALLLQQLVQQRGLAHVGQAHDGDLDGACL
jgi:hypothetical protein